MKPLLAITALGLVASCGGEGGGDVEAPKEKPTFADTTKKPTTAKTARTESGRDKSESERAVDPKKRWFDNQDKDGDGALTQDEVGNFSWVFLHQGDLDGDGKITPDELKEAREGGHFKRPEPTKVIEILDTDGDGQVGSNELPDKIRDRIPDVDVDGDGKVSLVEIEILNAKQDAERADRGGNTRAGGTDPNL